MGEVSEKEVKYGVLPNALRIINRLSMEKDNNNRRINCKSFKEKIFFEKHMVDVSFLERIEGEANASKEFNKILKLENIAPNTKSYVMFLTINKEKDYTQFIYDISKKFYYRGNKRDIYPITFILNGNNTDVQRVKKTLLAIMNANGEKIIFNDGYEDYNFVPTIFNMKPFSTNSPLNGKVNEVNYNYKVISLDTYEKNKSEIKFISPVFFYKDYSDKLVNPNYNKSFYIGNYSDNRILSLLGGRNG